jgi:two-component system, LytTR family, sensor kinase
MKTRFFSLFRFVGVPAIGLVFNFVTYFTTPPNLIAEARAEYGWFVNDVIGAVVTVLDALILSEGCLLIYRWLDRRFPWENNAAKRFWVQLVAHTVFAVFATMFVYFAFGGCIALLLERPDDFWGKEIVEYSFLFYQILFDATILSLLIVAVYTGFALFQRWQTATLETEALKRSQLLAQVAALQSQLDPHFLFNNLNTLTALIEDDPRQAVRFVEELSEVYRYVLQTRERETVRLSEELAFLRGYIFLATMRFGENFDVTIDIPHEFDETLIPPMALQLLVENAMKHNIISREKPLGINISADAGWVVVAHPLQLRSRAGISSTGIGLKNLQHRYAMLANTQPVVLQTASGAAPAFVVKLPLLPAQMVHDTARFEERLYANTNH